MERLPQNQANSRVQRERDFPALSRLVLLLFCGVVLTGGFLFAARQHFAAIQYGYQNEELRRDQQKLEAEKKRLLLEKGEASSPTRIKPAAEQIGMQSLQPGQIVIRKENKPSESQPAEPVKPAASRRR
jgi:cell division protein FtsL